MLAIYNHYFQNINISFFINGFDIHILNCPQLSVQIVNYSVYGKSSCRGSFDPKKKTEVGKAELSTGKGKKKRFKKDYLYMHFMYL